MGAINALTARQSTSHWIKVLGEAMVPCGPINNMQDVFADPHVVARGTEISLPHGEHSIPGVASPLRLSNTPPVYHNPPPDLGEHTLTILSEQLGLSDVEIKKLFEAGICGQKNQANDE